ncbi:hypothetical protein CDD80_748 [Ophiocordyceps camponoti-rufipedis]|uniref:Atos-like conserved domain-containing protein n=1 Tax=Ophiocordyceps camponoti-rufipedis TaxID=2004952 RepID=A0A2C5YGT9_9HYPO|nr:hypothetical protein CDD80_748 [Ophiocordyceps camponoti-rufipedis]
MPIFQADLDSGGRRRQPPAIDIGPVSPRLRLSDAHRRPDVDGTATSDRGELIQRLKRGESPTWIPNRLARACKPVPRLRNDDDDEDEDDEDDDDDDEEPPLDSILPNTDVDDGSSAPAQPGLRSPAQMTHDGAGIEHPRPALHTGDFTHNVVHDDTPRRIVGRVERKSTHGSWIATSPPRDFAPFRHEHRRQLTDSAACFVSGPSPLSSSLSSSFAYQPPTSPLVQSESNDDLDFSMPMSLSQRDSADMGLAASPFSSAAAASAWRQAERRRDSLPCQAHQPRRCLTTIPTTPTPGFPHNGSSPQTPAMLRSRRPSIGSDLSPIQHASMVGSYEESILRGRMSTTPSKPFDFLAQIGVLGKGKCRSSLRCPSHVTLPFPAVYYSYGGTTNGLPRDDDGPSPYVGQIDLENGLPNVNDESRSRRKLRTRYLDRGSAARTDGDPDTDTAPALSDSRRSRYTKRRRSASPRAPPGGSYRIPEKGQVQMVIKNQNKTAVKLFLVPYDLTGMEAGTKTFIRQRSYSAGPIVSHEARPNDDKRPMLRYLVHLHICCPSRGRFYLYKSIRVVFANRCPDGKEKLRNDTTWPEPRFSPYKPIRLMHPPAASLSAGPAALLAADKALRRRSLGIAFGPSSLSSPSARLSSPAGNTLPVDPVAYNLMPPFRLHSDSDIPVVTCSSLDSSSRPSSSSTTVTTTDTTTNPNPNDGPPTIAPPIPPPPPWGSTHYEKLSRGDAGYGGCGPESPPQGATEGLLSQRLRCFNIRNRRE